MPTKTALPGGQEFLALTASQLAQVLRGYRRMRGLTQQQAAERGGLLQKTVSALETAPGRATLESLLKLLVALDVELVLRAKPGASARSAKTR